MEVNFTQPVKVVKALFCCTCNYCQLVLLREGVQIGASPYVLVSHLKRVFGTPPLLVSNFPEDIVPFK